MKKQVAQFVPYADTLGVKKDTTGMTPVAVGDDGKLYAENYTPIIDDFYFSSAYGQVTINTKDGKHITSDNESEFKRIIADSKYLGKFAKITIRVINDQVDTEVDTLLQMVYTDAGSDFPEGMCSWVGLFMAASDIDEYPTPSVFGIETMYIEAVYTAKCTNYSGV